MPSGVKTKKNLRLPFLAWGNKYPQVYYFLLSTKSAENYSEVLVYTCSVLHYRETLKWIGFVLECHVFLNESEVVLMMGSFMSLYRKMIHGLSNTTIRLIMAVIGWMWLRFECFKWYFTYTMLPEIKYNWWFFSPSISQYGTNKEKHK